jgi:tetratricopeptide (TPR) repeat protein
MKRFLRFAVEQSLLKPSASVKEYAVALAVYDKPESFDPRADPIVRVEASRLRAKLQEYYSTEGCDDAVVISIRKGRYSAIVRRNQTATAQRIEQGPDSSSAERNPEAGHFYLMGRHLWDKRSPAAILQAIDCFKNAIALDPEYLICHAGLADCHAAKAWFEMGVPESLWQAVAVETSKALKVDGSMAEALTARAFKTAAFDWNWKESESLFRAAIASKPQYATAHDWYGFCCLAPQRRLTAAIEEIMRACALDPLSPAVITHLGCLLYFRRRYHQAVEQYLRALESDPTFHLAYWHLSSAYVQLSQFDEASVALDRARSLGCGEQPFRWAWAHLQARAGNKNEAEKTLERLTALSKTQYVSPVSLALVHSSLGHVGFAFECLNAAMRERSCRLIHIKVEPAFDALKTDPRFIGVLTNLHLL